MALLLSLRGTPCIYQGEELGLTEADIPYEQLVDPYGIAFWPTFKGRDGCRTPMPWEHAHPQAGFTQPEQRPWLPIPDDHQTRSVDLQAARPDSLLQKNTVLIQLHRTTPALHSDRIEVLESPEDLLVFERGEGEDTLLCVFNLSSEPIEYAMPERWQRGACLQNSGKSPEVTNQGTWLYPAWSWQWLTA